MSDFQRNLFQNRLKQHEKALGLSLNEEDDCLEEGEEEELSSLGDLPTFKDQKPPTVKQDGLILPKWSDYFTSNDIYRNPESGYCFQTYYSPPSPVDGAEPLKNPVVFIAHHGAGSTGLTFARLSSSLRKKSTVNNSPGLLTFDMRGHSNTHKLNLGNKDNLLVSIDQLCKDFIFILTEFYKRYFSKQPNVEPSFFLIGHSLGGSVLTKVINQSQKLGDESLPPYLKSAIGGLVMVDIVGDTAIKALGSMNHFLDSLPKKFPTLKKAIDWHLSTKLLNSPESALISVPGLVERDSSDDSYHWILDLKLTEQYWVDWFTDLSAEFTHVSSGVSKLLMLANNDYLDKDLMIGQMQGKYQLIIFHNNQLNLKDTLTTATKTIGSGDASNLGHFVHEDIPDKVAISLLEFVERNDGNSIARSNSSTKSQIDLLNKLNAKWGVKK